jgi:hypothetical protein
MQATHGLNDPDQADQRFAVRRCAAIWKASGRWFRRSALAAS